MPRAYLLALLAVFLLAVSAFAHDDDHPPDLRVWTDAEGLFQIEGSFVLARDGRVQLLKHGGGLVWVPLDRLSTADQAWVQKRVEEIQRLNGASAEPVPPRNPAVGATVSRAEGPGPTIAVAVVFGLVVIVVGMRSVARRPAVAGLVIAIGMATLMAAPKDAKTRPAIQNHFEPFKDKLAFRSDDRYFYVESNGLPDHRMMVGITAWQQQVPIAQPYTGRNAWQIPLSPRFADKPISAKEQLFRGAIALAVNGVPIFNPIKNDGRTDTFLAGELDEFGGHCGRADDYHYHVAPVHLEKTAGKGKPIAYALDGYPIYGYTDADGKEPKDLDEYNGRKEKDGYRYYSTKKYPYVNGGMRGVVTVKEDQIDPQPRARSPRPALPPLRGAKITGFTRDDEKKTATVEYNLKGKKHSVKYVANNDGSYTFVFTDGSGKEKTETYKNRPRGKKDRPNKDGPKKDDKAPRLPWLAAHFEELDTNTDGFLTLDELKKEVEKTFAAYDANKDGKLTKDEYDGKAPPVKSALAGFVRGHAAEFADNDAVISKDALMTTVTRMFERADRKKAGKITKAEASHTGPKRKE